MLLAPLPVLGNFLADPELGLRKVDSAAEEIKQWDAKFSSGGGNKSDTNQ